VWRLADEGTPLISLFSGSTLASVLLKSVIFTVVFGFALEIVAWFRKDPDARGNERGAA